MFGDIVVLSAGSCDTVPCPGYHGYVGGGEVGFIVVIVLDPSQHSDIYNV